MPAASRADRPKARLLDVVGSEVVEEPPALAEQDRDQESDVVRRFEAE